MVINMIVVYKIETSLKNVKRYTMTTRVTLEEAEQYAEIFCNISMGIMNRVGPFLKESIYRDLLVNELKKLTMATSCELVFNYSFKDSENKEVVIGNNHFLKSDIELLDLNGILELKQSNNITKQENIWQLRNYLEQRSDRHWGVVINFVSKFGQNGVSPHIQCDLLYSTGETLPNSNINTYYHSKIISKLKYPNEDDVLIMSEISI